MSAGFDHTPRDRKTSHEGGVCLVAVCGTAVVEDTICVRLRQGWNLCCQECSHPPLMWLEDQVGRNDRQLYKHFEGKSSVCHDY